MEGRNLHSKKIKELREKLKLNQAQFVDGLGVSQSSYSQVETGSIAPSLFLITQIVKKYKVSFDSLLDENKPIILEDEKIDTDIISNLKMSIMDMILLKINSLKNTYDELVDFYKNSESLILTKGVKDIFSNTVLNEDIDKGIREIINSLDDCNSKDELKKYLSKLNMYFQVYSFANHSLFLRLFQLTKPSLSNTSIDDLLSEMNIKRNLVDIEKTVNISKSNKK